VLVHGARRLTKLEIRLLLQDGCFWAKIAVCFGSTVATLAAFIQWVQQTYGLTLQPVKRPQGRRVLRCCLAVRVERHERWFNHFRRLSKDYEFLPTTSDDDVAMTRLMLKRLTQRVLFEVVQTSTLH